MLRREDQLTELAMRGVTVSYDTSKTLQRFSKLRTLDISDANSSSGTWSIVDCQFSDTIERLVASGVHEKFFQGASLELWKMYESEACCIGH